MSLLRNTWLTWASSFVLGGFFLYACWHKIVDPPDFLNIVYNYKIVPAAYINGAAIFMPWIELFAGLAVVTGIGRRGGALWLSLMLVVFIGALAFNLYRGHPTICGCTDTHEAGLKMTDEQKFWQMKTDILRDVGLFLLAIQVQIACMSQGHDAPMTE